MNCKSARIDCTIWMLTLTPPPTHPATEVDNISKYIVVDGHNPLSSPLTPTYTAHHSNDMGMWVIGPASATFKSPTKKSSVGPQSANPPSGHTIMPSTLPPNRFVINAWPNSCTCWIWNVVVAVVRMTMPMSNKGRIKVGKQYQSWSNNVLVIELPSW